MIFGREIFKFPNEKNLEIKMFYLFQVKLQRSLYNNEEAQNQHESYLRPQPINIPG